MKIYDNHSKIINDVTLINYANEFYTQSQQLNTKTALKNGRFKKVISYAESDIDRDFYQKNNAILKQKRGGGYWLWKPYFIKKTLAQMKDGELLFYCDSGSVFVNSIEKLLASFANELDVMAFELQLIENEYTKRDCFVLLDCENEKIIYSKQAQATFSLWRKSELSLRFVDEWLEYAQDPRVLTDLENQLGLPNYPGFIDHRHDQSIFSLLIKKNNIKIHRDPSQYGNHFFEMYPESRYPQLLVSTRQRNISFFKRIKRDLKPYRVPKIIYNTYKKSKAFFCTLLHN